MSNSAAIRAAIQNIDDVLNNIVKEVENKINTRRKEASKKIYKEFGEYQKKEIEKLFKITIDDFYNNYDPIEYDRTGGLYNLLDIRTDADGYVVVGDNKLSNIYNPSQMHANRSGGDNLYKTVFEEGWHGGSKGINAEDAKLWGEHPNPGIPHYRTWGWGRYSVDGPRTFCRFGAWDGEAARMQPSPRDLMYERYKAAYNSYMHEEFNKIATKHLDEAMEIAIKIDAPEVLRKFDY